MIGITYSVFSNVGTQSFSNVFKSECLNINFIENTEAISLLKTVPITNEEGIKLDPYSFEFTNTCTNMISYTISLEVYNESTLSEEYVRLALNLNEPELVRNFKVTEPTLE